MLEYRASLGVDLCFQGFDDEVRSLPGRYAEPRGALVLAFADRGSEHPVQCVGCVGLRPLNDDTAELKRLYVRPRARGLRVGRLLTEEAIQIARAGGYRRVVLDTLGSMTEANALYRSMGFEPMEAYTENPLPDPHFYERWLA